MAERPALVGGNPVRVRPWPRWPMFDDAERSQIEDVLQSRMWCYGPYPYSKRKGSKVDALQRRFARFIGVKYATAVANGTAALEVALRAAGVGPGDEVIVPSYTFLATASAVLQVGGTPVFSDIDPHTFNLDVAHAESLITKHTKAIVPVHFSGLPADMDSVMDLQHRHGLAVIEDCAQAGGSKWRDKRVGAIGDFGAFSFQQAKGMTAGEGGMVTTRRKAHADLVFGYYNLGRRRGGTQYTHYLMPWNYRMAELLAGVLLAQMSRLRAQIQLRMRTVRALHRALESVPGICLRPADPRVRANANTFFIFRYAKRGFGGMPRARFMAALRAEGIPCGTAYSTPLQEQPLFVKKNFPWKLRVDYTRMKTPHAKKLCREAVVLPMEVLMDGPQAAADVAQAVTKVRNHASELAR